MLTTILAQQPTVTQLDQAFQTDGVDGWDWARAGSIMLCAVVMSIVVRWAVRRVVDRNDGAGFAADLLGRLSALLVVAAGVVYSLSALGVQIGPLLGALGIVGIALAFALKDILENFVAGIILQVRRPFRRGDQIVTGDHEGRVVEVNSRAVVIDQPDGTRVIVPSSALITQPIVNLTNTGARRTTLEIGVAYDTDLIQARALILETMEGLDLVLDDPPPEALVSEFGDNAIVIAARFWHQPTIRQMWRARDEVAVGIKGALDASGIEIAFPQQVVWLRRPATETQAEPEPEAEPGTGSSVHAETQVDPDNEAEPGTGSSVHAETQVDPDKEAEPGTGFSVHAETQVDPDNEAEPGTGSSVHAETQAEPEPAAKPGTGSSVDAGLAQEPAPDVVSRRPTEG